MSTSVDSQQARKALEEERAKLVHQLEELGATESGDLRTDLDYGESFSDAAAATAERTERLGIIESLKTMLDDVDGALRRIEDGSYGVCTRCGTTISPPRLQFRPESAYCVDCKSKR